MNTTHSAPWLLLGSALLSLACTDAGAPAPDRGSLGATHQGLRVEEAVIGPEIKSGVPVPVAVPVDGYYVALTADGPGFFVVAPEEGYLRGSRIDPQGNPVGWDWSTFGESTVGRPTVALGAEHFLAIQDEGAFSAQLIDRDGQGVGPPFSLGLSGSNAELVWNGQNFGLTWQSLEDGESRVRFALLDPQGRLLVNEAALPAESLSEPSHVAAGRSHFVVTWMDWGRRAIYACPIGFDGRVEQSPVELARGVNVVGHPAIASNGERFLVTWGGGDGGGLLSSLHGALLDETGAVLVPEFEVSAPEELTGAPAVASDGADFVAVWTANANRDPGVILGTRVSASGNVSAPSVVADFADFWGVLGTGRERELHLAFNGTDYLAAMSTHAGLFGALFAADLTPRRSGLTLRAVANDQTSVQAVWEGADYHLSWIDVVNDALWRGPAHGTRITPNGGRLEPAVHSLSGDKMASGHQTASAGNGESLTVLQVDYESAWYSKSTASGESTPPTLLAPEAKFCGTLVASNGEGYLAVYCRPIVGSFDEFGNPIFGAWVAVFDRAATFLRTFPLAIGKNPEIQRVLAVATGYLLVFNDGQLKMARINPAGEVLYIEALPEGIVYSAGGARGSSNTLVLFYQDDWNVHGRFYGDMDWLGDAFTLPDEVEPWCTVAFDGTEYWVGWSPSDEDGIRLMNITEQGELGPPIGLAPDGWAPDLAGSPNGQVLLSYLRPNWDGSSWRIASRLLSSASPVPAGGGGSGGDAGAVGGGAPVAGGGSTGSVGGVGTGDDSGSSQAGSFSWPGGVSPLPSCSHAVGSRPSRGAPLSLIAGIALAMGRSLSRRSRWVRPRRLSDPK
jgi:hypothetical protein